MAVLRVARKVECQVLSGMFGRTAPCTSGVAEHLLAHGKWGMNSLFCCACVHSFCFIKLAVSLNQGILSHPILSPSQCQVVEVGRWGWSGA